MKLGTVGYGNKMYNLDNMTTEEIKLLLVSMDEEKKTSFAEAKKYMEIQ